MMRFEKTIEGEKVIIELYEDATIEEALDVFERFLRGCGYTVPYDQTLEFVDND